MLLERFRKRRISTCRKTNVGFGQDVHGATLGIIGWKDWKRSRSTPKPAMKNEYSQISKTTTSDWINFTEKWLLWLKLGTPGTRGWTADLPQPDAFTAMLAHTCNASKRMTHFNTKVTRGSISQRKFMVQTIEWASLRSAQRRRSSVGYTLY